MKFITQNKLPKVRLWIPNASIIILCLLQWCFIPMEQLLFMFDKLALFYWLLHRPDRISLGYLSLFYILGDILQGWPFGFSSLLMLLHAGITLLQRHIILKQTFFFQWLFLSFSILVNLIAFSCVYWVSETSVIPIGFFAFSAGFAILFYPLMTYVLFQLQPLVPLSTVVRV